MREDFWRSYWLKLIILLLFLFLSWLDSWRHPQGRGQGGAGSGSGGWRGSSGPRPAHLGLGPRRGVCAPSDGAVDLCIDLLGQVAQHVNKLLTYLCLKGPQKKLLSFVYVGSKLVNIRFYFFSLAGQQYVPPHWADPHGWGRGDRCSSGLRTVVGWLSLHTKTFNKSLLCCIIHVQCFYAVLFILPKLYAL